MSDYDAEYWAQHRAEYAACQLFHGIATKQHQDELERLQRADPIKSGIYLERGEPHFEKLEALATAEFGPSKYQRIGLKPDPWKSEGRWRIYASCCHRGIEGYVSTKDVVELLG